MLVVSNVFVRGHFTEKLEAQARAARHGLLIWSQHTTITVRPVADGIPNNNHSFFQQPAEGQPAFPWVIRRIAR